LLSSNYTKTSILSLSQKLILVYARVFDHATVKAETEGDFPLEVIVFLILILFWEAMALIRSIISGILVYDFFSLAGNSYIKSTFSFDYEFIKKII
jgi:NTE family protein